MLAILALAALKVQSLGPVLPPNCSPQFQQTFLSVEEAMQQGDFQKAKDRFCLLPTRDISINWDDSKVPAPYRPQFRKAAEEAANLWRGAVRGLTTTFRSDGRIKVSFEPVLATPPGASMPAARVGFFSNDPHSPRLDFVIGLKRGKTLKKTEEMDVFADVAYAIGSFLGVADGVNEANVMGPADQDRSVRVAFATIEIDAAKNNLISALSLAAAIKDKKSVKAAQPSLFLDPKVFESQPAIQGDRVEFPIQLSNTGDGSLSFSLFPDCGCSVVTDPGRVAPHSDRLVKVAVDTRNFQTDITKHVTVYTNDPTTPVQVVTLKVKLKPRYRLIAPLGDTFDLPTSGLKYPIYLIPAEGTNLDPVSTDFSGLPGAIVKVSTSPWTGMLADPERNEPSRPRKGFKVVLDIKGDIGKGRIPGTLQIFTANLDYPNLTYSFYAQKGILALPPELPIGELGHVPKTVGFLVSRPSAPFTILGISSSSPNLKAYVSRSTGPGEYVVSVEYDGKAKAGELTAIIRVKTSDPKQPIIEVPVDATIQ